MTLSEPIFSNSVSDAERITTKSAGEVSSEVRSADMAQDATIENAVQEQARSMNPTQIENTKKMKVWKPKEN